MFSQKRPGSKKIAIGKPKSTPSGGLESLENRQMLSASGLEVGLTGTKPASGPAPGTIDFSVAPAAVQSGLTQLASDDGLAAPAATASVKLGNRDGMESFSVTENSPGVSSRLTVDQNGKAVAKASRTTTTWDAFNADATNSAAATEITSIASGLSLTAPTSSTPVIAITTSTGDTNYVVTLASSTTSGDMSASQRGARGVTISVNAEGNPVGNQRLPFSVIPTAIQAALNSNVPSSMTAQTDTTPTSATPSTDTTPTGATTSTDTTPTGATSTDTTPTSVTTSTDMAPTIAPTSTDTAPSSATAFTDTSVVNVHTVDGTTFYSATVNGPGVSTTITVDASGKLASLPTQSTTTFGELNAAAQTELQTLVNQNGASSTIDASQKIDVLTQANGTGLYSLTASASSTDAGGTTHARTLVFTVDGDGNPTLLPSEFGIGTRHQGEFGGRRESNRGTGNANVTGHFATNASFAGLDAKVALKGSV
jgi:hypothetical protein